MASSGGTDEEIDPNVSLACSYDDTPYLNATSTLPIPGLFNNFFTAATLLRVARSELPWKALLGVDGEAIVSNFYNLLQRVEESRNSKDHSTNIEKFIVEVEGLDGSGKTSLVQSLAESLEGMAVKTPSASLSQIRPLWDHRGGILERAFYFISNYVLEYEIQSGLMDAEVIIIDRWYASTLAYTVAYRPEEEDTSIADFNKLPNNTFEWPSDLYLRPNLMLLLDIDPQTRQARVDSRKFMGGGASRFNPWDDRLAEIPHLAERIMAAFKSVQGPLRTQVLNANGTKAEVLNDALEVVRKSYQQNKHPHLYFQRKPLNWWRHDGKMLELCDEQGRRCHHALWNMQVAFCDGSAPPILKTVGLNHIDSDCIYYWSSSSSLDTDICNNGVLASVLWTEGTYPTEHQWRAEGFLTKVTKEECVFSGFAPPPSLLAHVKACEGSVAKSDSSSCGRVDRNDSYDDLVQRYSKEEELSSSTLCLWRFVPIRIEVLRGGPSTRISSYPQRWEWSHSKSTNGEWSMRSILPFTPSLSANPRQLGTWKLKNTTIALVGAHTSGKSTIGRRLSTLMGLRFDEELGKILRNEEMLVPNGHLYGDGQASTSKSSHKDQWDDLILQKESERDLLSIGNCRVVETWHGGNAVWNFVRRKKEMSKEDFQSQILQQYLRPMSKHQESASVLMIYLSIDSSSTILNRRGQDPTALERLPLQDERKDVDNLFCLNDLQLYESMAESTKIPLLVINNTEDGEQAIEKTIKSILTFVKKQSHLRVEM